MKKTIRSIIAVLLVAVLSFAMLAVFAGAEGEIYSKEYKDGDGNVVVLVSCSNDSFGSSELVVNEVSHAYDGFDVDDGYRKVLYALDMSFVEGDIVKVFPGESFTVKLRLPKAVADGESLLVYSLNMAGVFTPVAATVSGGYAEFTTSSFTVFAIAVEADAPVPFVNPDYTWVWVLVWIFVILAILGVIALLVIRFIKKKKAEFDSMAPTRRPSYEPPVPAFGEDEEKTEESEAAPVDKQSVENAPDVVVAALESEEAPVAAAVESRPESGEIEVSEENDIDLPEIISDEEAIDLLTTFVEKVASILPPPTPEELAAARAAAEEAADEPVVAIEEPAEEPAPEVVAVEEPAPVELPEPVININFVDAADKSMPGAEEAVSVRFRTSFESRYIQSGVLQDYYTAIKNLLLSYKGVKARVSWNHESFNKGRVQCAKINIKGNALLVYLNLDPAGYNVKKYHFNDMSSKPKFAGTPMLMKVKSERALKYTLELIAEMMTVLEIPTGKAQDVDYRVPFVSTEELAARGLVKIILPQGASLGDNLTAFKANVGEILEAEKSE